MDPEARLRRQSRRVVISEIIMVITVILMVIILALLVSGYWLNADFQVERQGMLQISSVPTGANVEVDGEAPWFQRTNTSKVLSSGEHQIKLEKDGYDTWSKTIDISEGLLYRLHYPRLFLLERTKTPVYDFAGVTFATISPAQDKLIATTNTTTWRLLSLEDEKISAKPLDIAPYISTVDGTTFTGVISSANWSAGGDRVLFKVQANDHTEWVLLDVNNLENSVNITSAFATDFSQINILDNAANNLLAVRGGNLHKIDISAHQISAILVADVESYDYLGSELIYSARSAPLATASDDTSSASTEPTYQIGLLRIGSSEPKVLETTKVPTRVFLSRFYDEKYITFVRGNAISVYHKDNFELHLTRTLSFVPTSVKIGHDGEFVIMRSGTSVATLDMESQKLREWQLDSASYGWLDSDMLYAVADGNLFVYDFDGENRRELSHNVSSRFPVAITNNKWLYYVSDDSLIREVVVD